ncbi:hypothetical protein F5B22DRAFT_199956 [Xylaria bambusicola]|uniref:uncharacterized protein n=1 Tax=Xylaria bambusicola TaxID=326684 RepID=UPI002008680D|nr:uncharacterized protein F5B22DRAFT_199956 [Xylaria bambusicola]KAI0515061.1 hypothetical protein F5B22DRAFT_199956 [Xylaria bambusicola]
MKAALLMGSIPNVILVLTFETSSLFIQVMISWVLGGFMYPNVGIVQTCIVEHTNTKEHLSQCFNPIHRNGTMKSSQTSQSRYSHQ